MQRHSEFPLFFQTAIALFGFVALIALCSAFMTPVVPTNHSTRPMVELAAH